jgi:hypothetical protein
MNKYKYFEFQSIWLWWDIKNENPFDIFWTKFIIIVSLRSFFYLTCFFSLFIFTGLLIKMLILLLHGKINSYI